MGKSISVDKPLACGLGWYGGFHGYGNPLLPGDLVQTVASCGNGDGIAGTAGDEVRMGLSGPPLESTWYHTTMARTPERPRLSSEVDVDVCVVGAGLAGLTVARELARRGRSVAVLEAGRVAWNASGRNAGFVRPGFAAPLETIIDRIGLQQARELWQLSVGGVEYVRAAIRDTGMPGVQPVEGHLEAAVVDDDAKLPARVALMQQAFAAEVELWPTDRVREVLCSGRYFHALHWPRAFHINPLNYAIGIAASAEQFGARIFEHSPALALDLSGMHKRVDTGEGRVLAQHIVLAGGALVGPFVPETSGTLMPIWTYLAVTPPLGDCLGTAIRYPGGVSEARLSSDTYRVIDGSRLLWGTGASTRPSHPRDLARRIAGRINRAYPQLGPIELACVWSGAVASAVHRMPQVGEVVPGVWVMNGFGLHGLNGTAMAGELVAFAIVDGDDRWRLFSAYELVWAGGPVGRAITELVLRSAGILDLASSTGARCRTVARRMTQPAAIVFAKGAGRVACAATAVATRTRRRLAQSSAAQAIQERIRHMSMTAVVHNAAILRGATKGRSIRRASMHDHDAELQQPFSIPDPVPPDSTPAATAAGAHSPASVGSER